MKRWIGRYRLENNTYQIDMKLHTDIQLLDVIEVMKGNVPIGGELINIATETSPNEFKFVWEKEGTND